MTRIFLKKLNEIQPSQLFISSGKLSQIMEKFDPPVPESFEPIPVKELDGCVIFIDGHTSFGGILVRTYRGEDILG